MRPFSMVSGTQWSPNKYFLISKNGNVTGKTSHDFQKAFMGGKTKQNTNPQLLEGWTNKMTFSKSDGKQCAE